MASDENGGAEATPEQPASTAETETPPSNGRAAESRNAQGRSTADRDGNDPTGIDFVDHFSLYAPSSTVKFRGARVHVYESANDQFLIEDHRHQGESGGGGGGSGRHIITVKRMSNTNFGMRFLRLVYTLVALLVAGYYFVFCFQLILFLFLQLPADAGRADQERNVSRFIGTVLAIPILLYGMASLMAMLTAFVTDTWSGGRLLRAVMGWSAVLTEVLYFLFFLGIPVLAIVVNLLAKNASAWESSALVWLATVSLAFSVFGVAVIWRELSSCYKLVATRYGGGGHDNESRWGRFSRLSACAVLHSQIFRYSGLREERYLVSGEDEQPLDGYSQSPDFDPAEVRNSLYSRMTQLGCCGYAFVRLENPRRLYRTAEVRDILPFVTSHSWSLESMCCRNRNARMIAAAKGPSALRDSQMKSSVACNVVGSILVLLLVVGALVWMDVGAAVYAVVAIFCVLCCVYPMARSSWAMYSMHREINLDGEGFDGSGKAGAGDGFGDEEDPIAEPSSMAKNKEKKERTTMFQVWETVKVTEPKAWYCWTRLVLEVAFLFFWPLGSIFASGNNRVGGVFIAVGILSFLRIYFDASAVLCEIGSMDDAEIGDDDDVDARPWWNKSILGRDVSKDERALVAKARLSEIVGKITKSSVVHRWIWAFAVLVLLVFIVFMMAVGSDDVQPGERPPIKLVGGYEYKPVPGLAYPTCEMSKGFTIPGVGSTALGDYAFMAALAYEMPNVTEARLAEWFGPGEVVDEARFVARWRLESGTADNPVYFKLFSFPNYPGIGLVSIRGSQTSWDWLVNMQLWSAAALAQAVKWLIPYGWAWNPILDNLVNAVNWVESDTLKKVAYYKVTTAFVNDVLAGYTNEYGNSTYDSLRVTGASLGGGLAIITGAQTEASAVAISGLGAELSRNTFQPPVTLDALNNNVFNFIPDRDVIARIGGRSRLFQEGQCTAAPNSLFGCHSMWRSVCEIAYRCGTGGRPVVCRCVEKFGYPEPEPIQNQTLSFAAACAAAGGS